MNFDKQKNPTDKDVKFILELLNSNKLSAEFGVSYNFPYPN